ncbi:MAG: DNA primase [Patescibacteria group bacterium]|nr:DNA primase [Patescibacteria group bacterium]
MFSSPIEEIKSKLDIKEVVGSYIKLQKAGVNYKAVCPFHGEKTPSLFVSPARQIWHCFGCNEGHSIFDFVMKIEGIEFGDALKILAQKAGVELKPIKPELRTKRHRLYEICELATKFYQKQLEKSSNGKKANQYLLNRKINEDSVKKWRLGWAPDAWQGLFDFLVSKNYAPEEIEKVGLAIKSDKGKYYDRFRSRIMFPVFDLNSQVVGFGGRVLEKKQDVAKYVNTPNTLLYDKSKILYGLDRSKVQIRKNDFCILTEGYVDVVIGHQKGIENMVAVSGTSLTPYQLAILKRYSNNLSLAFDMDFAGNAATKRGIDLAQSRGFNIKIIKMPKGKDPADILSQNDKDFKKMIDNSVSILDFHFQNALSQFDESKAEGKREISNTLLPVIKGIVNKIEQSHWIQELAKKLNTKERFIEEELKKVKIQKKDSNIEISEVSNSVIVKNNKQLLEERLITLLFKKPENLNVVGKETFPYFSEGTKKIINNFENPKKISKEFSDLFAALSFKAELEQMEDDDILPEIEFCLKKIKSIELKKQLDQISLQIRQAEQDNDSKRINNLTEEFNKLTKKIITT